MIQPDEKSVISNNKKKVLMIATGGTIVSKPHPKGGLTPVKGILKKELDDFFEMNNKEMPEIDVLEWESSIDSCYMKPKHWIKMSTQIGENYEKYTGFVIVHGTDTMAYSASALSFMLEGLGKPIVFTGAQIPLGELFNDARENLITSIFAAANSNIPEVMICFANKLTRGNRTTKHDNWGLNAFESPNYPLLGEFGSSLVIFNQNLNPTPVKPFFVQKNLFTNIVVIWTTPGFDNFLLEQVASCKPKKGIILACYGSGNAPIINTSSEKIFEKISSLQTPVVVTSQCRKGKINLGLYKAGHELMKLGFISGRDMTIEACVTKLSYLMGKGVPYNKLKKRIETNLRGELTDSNDKGLTSFTAFDQIHDLK